MRELRKFAHHSFPKRVRRSDPNGPAVPSPAFGKRVVLGQAVLQFPETILRDIISDGSKLPLGLHLHWEPCVVCSTVRRNPSLRTASKLRPLKLPNNASMPLVCSVRSTITKIVSIRARKVGRAFDHQANLIDISRYPFSGLHCFLSRNGDEVAELVSAIPYHRPRMCSASRSRWRQREDFAVDVGGQAVVFRPAPVA